MARRGSGRDRHLLRLSVPRVRGGDRALGAAEGVVCGICGRKMGRRRLSRALGGLFIYIYPGFRVAVLQAR
jgi:hypothetical protein